jgi:hypothetical protein
MKVGLVGENPNDTIAIRALLRSRLGNGIEFFDLLKNVNGDDLGNQKMKHRFRREFQIEKPDIVLFIRDLDALESDLDQMERRKAYFGEWNNVVDRKGIFLLNIFELEALIWADIESYNTYAKLSIQPPFDPMLIVDPKGELRKHGPYNEGQAREIFLLLRPDIVAQNCRYFADFLLEFEKRLA